MSDLTLPIIALTTLAGYIFSSNKKDQLTEIEDTKKEKISPNEVPNGPNVYSSNRTREVDAYVLETSQQMYKLAENPTESGVIPPIFNTYGIKGDVDMDKFKLTAFKQSKINDINRLQNILKPKTESAIENRPMFINNLNASTEQPNYIEVENISGNKEISILTGLPLEREHTNMIPFFGGVKKQNVEEFSNVPLLDVYTGNKDTFRHKREVKINKEQPENIYGNPVFSGFIDTSRYIPSTFKQNEAPVDKIYVPAPIAGTVDNKILPSFKDVNDLRVASKPKVSYKARNAGFTDRYNTRGISGKTEKNRPETFYAKGQDHLFAGPGAYFADKLPENFFIQDTARQSQHQEYYGNADSTQLNKTTARIKRQDSVDNSSELYSMMSDIKRRQIGVEDDNYVARNIGFAPQVTDYGKKSFNLPELERDSTNKNDYHTNLSRSSFGQKLALSDQAKITIRQSTETNEHSGFVDTSLNQGGKVSSYEKGITEYDPKSTQRESIVQDYTGIAKHQVESHQIYSTYENPEKMRVPLHPENYIGPMGSTRYNQNVSRQNYLAADITDKHEKLLSGERPSGPQNFQISGSKNLVNMTAKPNTTFKGNRDSRPLMNPNVPQNIVGPEQTAKFDASTNLKAVLTEQENNRFNDVEISQLQNNPFHNKGPQLL